MKWERRKKVKRCDYMEYIDCPRCGLECACNHEDAVDIKCSKEICPLFDGKKWKNDRVND